MHKTKMNRQQRRAAVSALSKASKGGWEPLKVVNGVVGHPDALPGLVRAYNNHTYSVQVFAVVESRLGLVTPLGIRRHDQGLNFPWYDLQRIKNEVTDPERAAIEVFPAESDLVDDANMRWMWVLESGVKFKFNPTGKRM